jgi:hypothetical protein
MNINGNLFTQKPEILNNTGSKLYFGTYGQPARGRRESDTVELKHQSRSNSPNKGKELPPELALQRKAESIHHDVKAVCDWLQAGIKGETVSLTGDAAVLLAETLTDDTKKRETNIDNVFDGRNLKEGKIRLQQKKKEALDSITSFPALARVLVIESHPEITISNIKGQLGATVDKYNEYIHAKQWLDRWDKIGTPTK